MSALRPRVPPRVPQFPRKFAFRARKWLCLQREAAASGSAVNRRLVGSRRNWTEVTSKALTVALEGFRASRPRNRCVWAGSRIPTTDLGSRRSLNTGSVGRSGATWTPIDRSPSANRPASDSPRVVVQDLPFSGENSPPHWQFSREIPLSAHSNAYGAHGQYPLGRPETLCLDAMERLVRTDAPFWAPRVRPAAGSAGLNGWQLASSGSPGDPAALAMRRLR